jgi:hypothetical protein
MYGNPRPPVTDPVPMVPPTRGRGHKRSPITAKRPNSVPRAAQVMTQVELPPFYGPHSPLDSIAIEIIFGRIFEAFCRMSKATAEDDKPPEKRRCRVPIAKKMQAPRYSDLCFFTF